MKQQFFLSNNYGAVEGNNKLSILNNASKESELFFEVIKISRYTRFVGRQCIYYSYLQLTLETLYDFVLSMRNLKNNLIIYSRLLIK